MVGDAFLSKVYCYSHFSTMYRDFKLHLSYVTIIMKTCCVLLLQSWTKLVETNSNFEYSQHLNLSNMLFLPPPLIQCCIMALLFRV